MKKYLFLLSVVLWSSALNAQNLGSLILASSDSNLLTQNYLNPALQGMMSDMNSGWYSSAKIHKTFGFDISLSANVSLVPDSGKYFTFNASDYNYLSTQNGETQLETVLGEAGTATTIDVSIPYGSSEYKISSFDLPGGVAGDLPLNGVPLPMIQFGLGLPIVKADLKFRFLPKQTYEKNTSVDMFGVGLQYELTKLIVPASAVLPLHISIFGGFTSLNSRHLFASEPGSDVQVSNGEAAFKLTAMTVQAIGSIDFAFLSLYGSVGYNMSNTKLNVKGDYTLNYNITDNNGMVINTVQEQISNPLALEFSQTGPRSTFGARLNLLFFKIFADYTFQKYNTLTAGVAFSFR